MWRIFYGAKVLWDREAKWSRLPTPSARPEQAMLWTLPTLVLARVVLLLDLRSYCCLRAALRGLAEEFTAQGLAETGGALTWRELVQGLSGHRGHSFLASSTGEASCAAMSEQLLATGHVDGIRLWGPGGAKMGLVKTRGPVLCLDLCSDWLAGVLQLKGFCVCLWDLSNIAKPLWQRQVVTSPSKTPRVETFSASNADLAGCSSLHSGHALALLPPLRAPAVQCQWPRTLGHPWRLPDPGAAAP